MKLNIRKAKEVGVTISFDDFSPEIEKFGFENEQEIVDFIKENLGDGTFMIYEFQKDGKTKIMMPIVFGDKEDLDG